MANHGDIPGEIMKNRSFHLRLFWRAKGGCTSGNLDTSAGQIENFVCRTRHGNVALLRGNHSPLKHSDAACGNLATRVGDIRHFSCRLVAVLHGPLDLHVEHPPVEANTVAGPPLVLAERLARRAHKPPVARQHDPGVGGLKTELVDHVGRQHPVGVDQSAFDPQVGPVIAGCADFPGIC